MADKTYDEWSAGETQRLGGYGVDTSQFTDQQKQLMQRGYQDYQTQQAGNRQTQGFLNAQENWYPQLQQSYMNAVRPGIDQGAKQASTQQSLQDISRGTRGGSQGLYNQGKIQQAYQTQLGQAQQQSAKIADSQKSQDLMQAQQQRMGMFNNPYSSYGQQSQMQNIQGQMGANAALNQVTMNQMYNNQQAQNMWSQLYGSQLSTAGNAVKMIGMGGF